MISSLISETSPLVMAVSGDASDFPDGQGDYPFQLAGYEFSLTARLYLL